MVFESVSKECHSVRLCLRNFGNLFVCCKRCWLPLAQTCGRNMNLMNFVFLFCFDVVRTVVAELTTMVYGEPKPSNARMPKSHRVDTLEDAWKCVHTSIHLALNLILLFRPFRLRLYAECKLCHLRPKKTREVLKVETFPRPKNPCQK